MAAEGNTLHAFALLFSLDINFVNNLHKNMIFYHIVTLLADPGSSAVKA